MGEGLTRSGFIRLPKARMVSQFQLYLKPPGSKGDTAFVDASDFFTFLIWG